MDRLIRYINMCCNRDESETKLLVRVNTTESGRVGQSLRTVRAAERYELDRSSYKERIAVMTATFLPDINFSLDRFTERLGIETTGVL